MGGDRSTNHRFRLERFQSPADFAAATSSFLADHEIGNGLLIGLTARLIADPRTFGGSPYLALVRDTSAVVAVALMTPPWNLVISRVTNPAALPILVQDVTQQYSSIPGVNGPREVSEAFAAAWESVSGGAAHLDSRMRIYAAETILPPTGVPGALRQATQGDRPLIELWMDAFFAERNADAEERQRAWEDVARRFDDPDGGWYLWYDDDPALPVSLVGFAGPTQRGIRIGPVYTPPTQRGRGYASAATAAVSQLLIDRGWHYCFLFTELTNHTANRIYPAIGYRVIDDADVYRFVSSASSAGR